MLSSFEPLITWRLAFSYLMIAIRTSLIDLGIHDVVVAELSSCLFPFLPLPRFLLRQTNWVPITFSLPSTPPVQNSSSCYWTLVVLTSLLVDLLYIAPLVSLIPQIMIPRVICHNEYPKIVFPYTLLAVMTLFGCFHACFADSNRFLKVLNSSYYCTDPTFLVINYPNPNCLRTILGQ
jgi:hypothetical protein